MSLIKKFIYKFKLDYYYGFLMSKLSLKFGKPLRIMNVDDTVDYIIKTNCSVARFGDGELHIAVEGCSIGFQDADNELKKRLRFILKNNYSSCLLCIPSPINDDSYMNKDAQNVWREDLKINRFYWRILINKSVTYGDTQFTRPYIDYSDKSKSLLRFNRIKEIWVKKRILLIEGSQSKLGVNNDLFKDVIEIKRILCPSRNAFSCYEKIIKAVKTFSKEYLILIALGPTATVLAYDLSLLGYRALDIGHLDIEYEWCKLGVNEKVAVKGKYTNEINHHYVESNKQYDQNYESQIVLRID